MFDNLSIEIRKKRISRDKALKIVFKNNAQRPENDIKKFCKFTNISISQFDRILEKFRNKSIWKKKKKGKWFIKNFLLKQYSW